MVHLLRNSLDHGIEKSELRQEQGKPEKGRITLEIMESDNGYQIKLEDDGQRLEYGTHQKYGHCQ